MAIDRRREKIYLASLMITSLSLIALATSQAVSDHNFKREASLVKTDVTLVYACGYRAGQDVILETLDVKTDGERDFCKPYRLTAVARGFNPEVVKPMKKADRVLPGVDVDQEVK